MNPPPRSLLSLNRTVDRASYFAAGLSLFLIKFGLDWVVARFAFGRSWSPLNYLIWPNDRSVGVLNLTDPDRWFGLTMVGLALPFIAAGVVFTLLRLRDAGLPLPLVALFFVPVANWLLFLALVLLPSKHPAPVAASDLPHRLDPWQRAHRSIARGSHWRSGLLALAIAVPLSVFGVWLGAQVLQSYGFSLFLGAPFALGMVSVLVFGLSRPQELGRCILVSVAAFGLAGVAVLGVALEGAICLVMASPIALFLNLLGALVGFAIQSRPWLNEYSSLLTLAVLALLPSLMAAEALAEPEPELREVRTEVIVEAPPEKVWPLVIAFPPLKEPNDWLFLAGVAYPCRAEIQGSGRGAVRHCVFSTGTFVEPVDVWEPPTRLVFRVTDQPPAMREWSPYTIHPPHLQHYLVCQQGEFRLEALPEGRTRLTGTTWYRNRMWPAAYWHLWSDHIIHRIHERVLNHIQNHAEGKAAQ